MVNMKAVILAGGVWYKTMPHYRSVKQASFAYIQQTYDILSAVAGDASWYKS